MNHDDEESLAYAKHLLSEHRRVHRLVRCIEERWSLAPDPLREPSTLADLLQEIQQLREELVKHFEEEEAGGVLEEASARCPDLGLQEMQLEQQHAALLGDLDRIIADMRMARDVGRAPAELRRAFGRFVERLHAHEEGENRVLEEGFGVEVA